MVSADLQVLANWARAKAATRDPLPPSERALWQQIASEVNQYIEDTTPAQESALFALHSPEEKATA